MCTCESVYCVNVYMSVSMYVDVRVSMCTCVCLYKFVGDHVSVHMYTCVYIDMTVLFVCEWMYL